MFKVRYQAKRLVNMYTEWKRLNKLFLFTGHFRHEWGMNSYIKDHRRGLYGMPERPVYLAGSDKNSVRSSDLMRDSNGTVVTVKRDLFDQVVDTFSSIINRYWRNVVIQQMCTHPHEKSFIEWEGDGVMGYVKQHYCYACGTYIGDPTVSVDRYLPPEERRPDLIGGEKEDPITRRRLYDNTSDTDKSTSSDEETLEDDDSEIYDDGLNVLSDPEEAEDELDSEPTFQEKLELLHQRQKDNP